MHVVLFTYSGIGASVDSAVDKMSTQNVVRKKELEIAAFEERHFLNADLLRKQWSILHNLTPCYNVFL